MTISCRVQELLTTERLEVLTTLRLCQSTHVYACPLCDFLGV